MMKFLKNNRAFTLIEVLISIGILGIAISIIGSFFLSNIKTFNNSDTQIELQYQLQILTSRFSEIEYEVQRVEKASFNSDKCTKLVFKEDGSNNYLIFEHKDTKIFYTKSTNPNDPATTEFCNYIDSLKIKPVTKPNYTDLDLVEWNRVKGIDIEITVTKDGKSLNSNSTIYFRNWK